MVAGDSFEYCMSAEFCFHSPPVVSYLYLHVWCGVFVVHDPSGCVSFVPSFTKSASSLVQCTSVFWGGLVEQGH